MPSKLFRPAVSQYQPAMTTPVQQNANTGLPANFAQLKNIYSMMNNGANGQAMAQNLMQAAIANNPQLGVMINTYNGDYKAAFYAMAKQQGKDPEQFASMLQEALR